jgi:hypothetical protein
VIDAGAVHDQAGVVFTSNLIHLMEKKYNIS